MFSFCFPGFLFFLLLLLLAHFLLFFTVFRCWPSGPSAAANAAGHLVNCATNSKTMAASRYDGVQLSSLNSILSQRVRLTSAVIGLSLVGSGKLCVCVCVFFNENIPPEHPLNPCQPRMLPSIMTFTDAPERNWAPLIRAAVPRTGCLVLHRPVATNTARSKCCCPGALATHF